MDVQEKHALRALIDSAYAPNNCGHELCTLLGAMKERHRDGVPAAVASRVPILKRIYTMAQDSGWDLPCVDKKRIGGTMLYLMKTSDMPLEPAEIAVLQSAATDLLVGDCSAELENYEEFCRLRDEGATNGSGVIETRADWLRYKREHMNDNKRTFFGMRRSRPSRSGGLATAH